MLSPSPALKCPRCRGGGSYLDLERVRRRLVDRLISLIRPRHRYRCRSMGCDWEGNLPARPARYAADQLISAQPADSR
jgi:hypothetical protein